MITFPPYFFVFHVTSKQDREWLNFFNQKIVKQIFFLVLRVNKKFLVSIFFCCLFFQSRFEIIFFYKTTHSRKVIEKKKTRKREETNLKMALLNPSSLLMPILFHLSHSQAIIKMRKSTEMAIFLCGESEKKTNENCFYLISFFKGKWKRTNLLTIAIQGK